MTSSDWEPVPAFPTERARLNSPTPHVAEARPGDVLDGQVVDGVVYTPADVVELRSGSLLFVCPSPRRRDRVERSVTA